MATDAGALVVVPLPNGPADVVELEPVPVVRGRLELGLKVGATELPLASGLLVGTTEVSLLVRQIKGVLVVLKWGRLVGPVPIGKLAEEVCDDAPPTDELLL